MIRLTAELELIRIGEFWQDFPARRVTLFCKVLDLISARFLIETLPLLGCQGKTDFDRMEERDVRNGHAIGVQKIYADNSGADPFFIICSQKLLLLRRGNGNRTFPIDGVCRQIDRNIVLDDHCQILR